MVGKKYITFKGLMGWEAKYQVTPRYPKATRYEIFNNNKHVGFYYLNENVIKNLTLLIGGKLSHFSCTNLHKAMRLAFLKTAEIRTTTK
ncbi:MAG: hypothetical protein Q8O88_03490 [bacterium]|nr:hypothetical protein [bacterium]